MEVAKTLNLGGVNEEEGASQIDLGNRKDKANQEEG